MDVWGKGRSPSELAEVARARERVAELDNFLEESKARRGEREEREARLKSARELWKGLPPEEHDPRGGLDVEIANPRRSTREEDPYEGNRERYS